MEGWGDGYITEIEYTHGFYRELAPSHLRLALATKGVRAPSLEAGYTYCELGSGQGFTTNLLAAANPAGQFWGVDLNPAHVAGARRLSAEAKLSNVRFLELNFAGLQEVETPEFDVISLHGVYSWIGEETRRRVVAFIRDRLKPGGLVYISYNTLPGWTAIMPLRQLLSFHATGSGLPVAQRIDAAVAFAEKIKDLRGSYLAGQRQAIAALDRIKGQGKNYLAHEYFNKEWRPFYHAEVAAELAEAKLSYGASAYLADAIDALNVSSEAGPVLAEINDPTLRETFRDYLTNQRFRRDLFLKGVSPMTRPEQSEVLRATGFVLQTLGSEIPFKATFPVGEINLQARVHKPVLEALAAGPKTMAQLLAEPAVGALGIERTVQAIMVMNALGHIAPCLAPADQAAARARVEHFNRVVMERARFGADLVYLASPVTGSGVTVNRFQQLFLLARRHGSEPVRFVWDLLARQGQRVFKDGKPLQDEKDNLAELQTRFEEFEAKRQPILKGLGIE